MARARASANTDEINSLAPSTVDLGWRRDLPSWCPYAKQNRVWKKITSEADAVSESTAGSLAAPEAQTAAKRDGLNDIPVGDRQTVLIFLRSHPRPTPELVRSFAADSGIDPAVFAQYLAAVQTQFAARTNP